MLIQSRRDRAQPDDAGRFLPSHVGMGIFPGDYFQLLDQASVGRLIRMIADYERRSWPNMGLHAFVEQN